MMKDKQKMLWEYFQGMALLLNCSTCYFIVENMKKGVENEFLIEWLYFHDFYFLANDKKSKRGAE